MLLPHSPRPGLLQLSTQLERHVSQSHQLLNFHLQPGTALETPAEEQHVPAARGGSHAGPHQDEEAFDDCHFTGWCVLSEQGPPMGDMHACMTLFVCKTVTLL